MLTALENAMKFLLAMSVLQAVDRVQRKLLLIRHTQPHARMDISRLQADLGTAALFKMAILLSLMDPHSPPALQPLKRSALLANIRSQILMRATV